MSNLKRAGRNALALTRRQVISLGVIATGSAALPLRADRSGPKAIKDKTLVAWVRVNDPLSRGGSALTIGQGEQFDGIVYGELSQGKWMPGSEMYRRTLMDQAEWPTEPPLAAGQWVQVALVYRDRSITFYRNASRIWSYEAKGEPAEYGDTSYVMFGWRHMGAGGNGGFLKGAIRDARIFAQPLTETELKGLEPGRQSSIVPYAWWDFSRGIQDRMKRFRNAAISGGARLHNGALELDGVTGYLSTAAQTEGISRIQFRPKRGVFADPIPFYWKGQYHVFYLQGGVGKVPWQHIVSNNLVDWKELPTALVSDGAPDSFDGLHMFTGSTVEKDGRFYIHYTGWNPANPLGRESILCAESDDLIHWKKRTGWRVEPEGDYYSNKQDRDFRDAYVFKNQDENCYWMVLCANALKGGGPGLFTSQDMLRWTAQPALKAPNQECPDLFKIGETWYLIGGDAYSYAADPRGEFHANAHNVVDRPGVYAGKRMFDGRRHVWVGWIWDTNDKHDNEGATWGGTMSLPRELYAGPNGILYVRPVAEVVAAFRHQPQDLLRGCVPANGWRATTEGISTSVAGEVPTLQTLRAPLNGMFEIEARLSEDAEVTLLLRCAREGEPGYLTTIRPPAKTVITSGGGLNRKREGVALTRGASLKIRAFVLGTTIELFINDEYAFTRRAYDLTGEFIGLRAEKGSVTLKSATAKQHRP